jgi:hypothetical protein
MSNTNYTESEVRDLLAAMAAECDEQGSFYGRGDAAKGVPGMLMSAPVISNILKDSLDAVLDARDAAKTWTATDEAESRRDH